MEVLIVRNGELVYNNNNIVTKLYDTTDTLGYTVGSYVLGGVIAYIFVPGDSGYSFDKISGIVVSVDDILLNDTYNHQFGGMGINIITTSSQIGYGKQMTESIVSQVTGITAAKMTLDYIDGIYDDWFLPTQKDIEKIIQVRGLLPNILELGFYWTCTQYDTTAMQCGYATGFYAITGRSKTEPNRIRPIRYFYENNTSLIYNSSYGEFNGSLGQTIIYPDGKTLVGGNFTSYSGQSYNNIIRLNSGGTIDTSFVIGSGFNDIVYDMKLQSDNKIICVGRFTSYSGQSYNNIIRLNSDGSIDTSFVIGSGFIGIPSLFVYTLYIQTDGKILVGGQFDSYNGVNYKGLIRLNSGGTIDTSFVIGSGFNSGSTSYLLNNINVQTDGKILIGGTFTDYSGKSSNSIVRLNSGGTIDTSFVIGSGFYKLGNSAIYYTEIQTDGKILVGGNFTSYSGQSYNNIIRLNSGGTIDTSFVIGSGFSDYVNTIKLQSDNKILVGGRFTSYSGLTHKYIVRLNSGGTVDTSFNVGTGFNQNGIVSNIKILSGGRLLIIGGFDTYNNYVYRKIIILNSDGSV